MLNIEQLLIKAAQYFDMNLKELKIKHTDQKKRFYKNHLLNETHSEIFENILTELDTLNINKEIAAIIYKFLYHYEYLQREIFSHFDEKDKKRLIGYY